MKAMTAPELLGCALKLGRRLLECGAEIYRVEESIQRMCLAYGAQSADVYAVPTAIIATVQMDAEHVVTQTCRINQRGTDLNQVAALNALCRMVCICPVSYEQFQRDFERIERQTSYPNRLLCVACGGVAAFFTWLFGGSLGEGIWAFLIGVVLQIYVFYSGRFGMHPIFTNLLGGIWISFAALIGMSLGLAANYDVIIIGAIMPLVPGLLMTNSIRDMIAGDFMSGISRFCEALLIAAGIAAGAAIPLSLRVFFMGVF